MTTTLFLQAVLAGLTNGFVYSLIGMGIAVVFRGARIINALQGDLALVGGVVAYVALELAGWPLPLAFAAGVVAGGTTSFLAERLLVRPIERRNGTEDSYLLATLGGAFTISALVLLSFGRDGQIVRGIGGEASVDIFDAAIRVHALWLMGISAVVVTALKVFYDHTRLGQSMLAASIDRAGALTIGIDVPRMRSLTFLIGGLLGGLAGVLISPMINVQYEMGLLLTLKGFAAAVLGGLASPFGAMFGGITLGVVESLAAVSISSGYKDVITMSALVLIMIFMPQGLIGRKARLGG